MNITDWRELEPARILPLYEQQGREWTETLGWDLTPSWNVIERARAAGMLPGFVSMNSRGVIDGWTFYMRQNDVVQIGALVGHGATPVRDLLEAILDAPEATGASELTCLLYPARPNALSALTRRRFVLQRLRYFVQEGPADASSSISLPSELTARRWRDEDAVACVRVLARAYGQGEAGRSLAPHGTLDEWAHYLGQVLRTPACGVLLPRASFVVEDRAAGMPVGFLLTTTVGPATAHVAQIAVDPSWSRRGVGRMLLRLAVRAAATEKMDRTTLLVSGHNDAALRLYSSEGFAESTEVVFASRPMPIRRQASMNRLAA
jgi:ribosomal protein S18 acetylase RimI-like enzyme